MAIASLLKSSITLNVLNRFPSYNVSLIKSADQICPGTFIIATFSPVIKQIVAGLRYAALTERDSSKEVIVESSQSFEKLSAQQYARIPVFMKEIIVPAATVINSILDSMPNENMEAKKKDKGSAPDRGQIQKLISHVGG